MQNAWLAKAAVPCCDTDAVVERINHAIASIRREGGEPIFVQHADEEAVAGSPGWQLLAALDALAHDRRIDKTACDAFADTDLAEHVAGGTVYVCGFATEFCVDTTIRAAASRGLTIVALADAHTTSNRPHLDARSIIAHHNWVWSNMAVGQGSSLAVMPTAQAFPT